MRNNAIVSLAILKVNFDEKKDYLQTFVPIVAETIRCSNNEIVSVVDVQRDIINNFGLNIPQNAIKAILKKVKKEGYIYIEDRVYKRNNTKIKKLDFHLVRQDMLKKQEEVIKALITYCEEKFQLKWSTTIAEDALQDYIEENQIFKVKNGVIPKVKNVADNTKYYVGLFVQSLLDNDSYLLEYLEDVIKGMMISTTLFVKDAARIKDNFRDTDIYLDTAFVVYVLGYAGKAKQEPCKELLDMLYESGARVRCFTHTVDEIKGVLKACANKIGNNDLDTAYGPSIEYFISEGKTSSDIIMLISQLEKDMNLRNIKIVDKPLYNNRCYIDEQDLKDQLSEGLFYRNENAIERDVDSISAILRLRKGRNYAMIEDCRALFVTTNNKLVNFINLYLFKGEEISGAMPIVSDYTLTNLLWLKKPMKIPDLPRKKIIADCFAATQPDERLWNKYINEVNKLKDNEEIGEDESYYFKYAPAIKEIFMEVTKGSEEAICEGTVKEIIDLSRKKIEDETRHSFEESNRLLAEKIEYTSNIIKNQNDNIENYARTEAKKLGKIVSYTLTTLVLIALFCSLPIVTFLKFSITIKAIALFGISVFLIITLFSIYKGSTIKGIANYIETKRYHVIVNKLKKNNEHLEVAFTEVSDKSADT